MTSQVEKNSSWSSRSTPTAAARSSLRLRLHAVTRIPSARPTGGMSEPMLPNPTMPIVLPPSWVPMPSCQAPWRMPASSFGTSLAKPSIKAQVSSTVAVAPAHPPVPHTTIPSSLAAATSMTALAMPLVTRSRRPGRPDRTSRPKAVRSRMATTASKGCRRLTSCWRSST